MSLPVRSRVWDIPELVRLISSWLPRNDCVHLAYTCRLCFEGAIGFVWYKVRGANNVLCMLPGTGIDVESDHGNKQVQKIDSFHTSDLGRFHFYALLIRYLDICEPESLRYHAGAWDTLPSCSFTQPLLPNLEHLTLNHSIQLVSEKLSLWLKPFLSPKLKSFETWDHMGRRPLCVTSLELAEFAGLLVQHCPLLETLVLPYGKSEIQTADGMRLSVFSENALTYQHLTHAQSLVSLTADRRVLNPAALPIIGRLPQLETLNLYACVFPDRLSITPNLASDLFLKLKHLFIEGSVFSELKELWRMKQLVQGLTSVSIHLESDTYSITLPPVFLDFGRTSPHIDTLTIKYPDTIFMKPHELRALSNLSLHTLTLSGLEFGSFASFCRILGESVPLLKRLRLLRWTLDIWELVEMSKLLELENLAVAINWSPTYLDCPGLEGSIQRCDKLRILECNPLPSIVSSDESKLQNISRFILGVGPNIRSAEPLPECKHGEGYQKLNDSIKDLRDASTRSHPPTRYTTI